MGEKKWRRSKFECVLIPLVECVVMVFHEFVCYHLYLDFAFRAEKAMKQKFCVLVNGKILQDITGGACNCTERTKLRHQYCCLTRWQLIQVGPLVKLTLDVISGRLEAWRYSSCWVWPKVLGFCLTVVAVLQSSLVRFEVDGQLDQCFDYRCFIWNNKAPTIGLRKNRHYGGEP